MLTNNIVKNWTLWFMDELDNKVTCQICGKLFIKKNVRMLSHLGYATKNGGRDTTVNFYKNVKLELAGAFGGCSGVTPTPLRSTKLYQLQCIIQSEESTCQGIITSTMYKTCSPSKILAAPLVSIPNTSTTAL
jgi:hypothetical protein